jgi:hypothetical protein
MCHSHLISGTVKILKKYATFVKVLFLNVEQQHGKYMNGILIFWFNDNNYWPIGGRHMKFSMKYTINIQILYEIWFTSQLQTLMVQNFEVMCDKFNGGRICA